MQWIRSHPYASAAGAAALILAGMFVIVRRSTAPATGNTGTWSSPGVDILNPSYAPAQQPNPGGGENITQRGQGEPPYSYTPPTIPTTTSESAGGTDPLGLKGLIQKLSQNLAPTPAASSDDSSITDPFSFLRSGVVSTTTALVQTSAQKAIYEYGNEVGSYVQSFEEQHPTAVNILKDQAEDRTNPQKVAAVEALAQAMKAMGHNLLSMESVPSGMASAHEALASSYIAIGTNLSLVAKAPADDDFVSAIQTYNGSVDTFIKNYITLSTLFSAYGVNFGSGDAGSVFTFTSGSL